MKKILITLIACTFIGISVNAQTKKASTQAKTTTPVATMEALAKSFIKALPTTSLTKHQQSSCREYYFWALKNKERINNDATLTATAKQEQLDNINKVVNEKIISILNANDLKILSPYIK